MASAVLKFGRVIRKSGVLSKFQDYSRTTCPRKNIFTSSQLYATTEVFMPSLSPTMSEGTIVKWYKNEGDKVNPGDVLCDIQTDKAVVSLDTEEEGILAKILKSTDSKDIKVGALIALMVEEGDDWQNVEIPAQAADPDPQSTQASPSPVQTTPPPAMTTPSSPGISAQELEEALHMSGIGPSVRKLVEEYGVNIKAITGSGPQNRIMKGDVLKYIESQHLSRLELSAPTAAPPSAPAPPLATPAAAVVTPTAVPTEYPSQFIPDIEGEVFVDIPNTGMRTTIAKRLTLSKQSIPHSYVTMECNVGPVTKLRKKLKQEDVKVSVNDFIIKSAAVALQRVPQVNSVWQNEDIQAMAAVDICVAVATDNGLITPIVKNAPVLAVDQISATVKDLADRARQNKLQLQEFQGGTFTISNLGMFGISEFSAVINPPQTAIMAVGSSQLAIGGDGKPESRMTVTLSYDARVIDEGEASQFLEVFRDTLENPQLLMSGSPASRRNSVDMF